MTLLLILLLLLVFAGWFGFAGPYHGRGYMGWSPLGLIILVIVILLLTGNLHY